MTDDATLLMLMAYCSGQNTWEIFGRIVGQLGYRIEDPVMKATNLDKWYQTHNLPPKLKAHSLDRPQGPPHQWMLSLVAKCWLLMSDLVRAASIFFLLPTPPLPPPQN